MKIAKGLLISLLLTISLIQIKATFAGPYSDELAKCVVESSSTEDLTVFVRWMFSTLSLHPSLKSMASITGEQRDEANKQCGEIFMRLLTVSCKEQAQKAWKYEGQLAVESSFNILGRAAARELFSHPNVQAGMAGLQKYFDKEKLKSVFSTK